MTEIASRKEMAWSQLNLYVTTRNSIDQQLESQLEEKRKATKRCCNIKEKLQPGIQLDDNKNSVVTQKLCHDTELSKGKDSQVATWKLGRDINT